ncbi:MAG TPA: SH3 domain-containing protein [Candidatus Acidoferrales bacterium]
MKLRHAAAILILTSSATAAFAQAPAFSFCGTYGAYVMLYKNTDQFEELGKLRCGEKVEVISKYFDYLQILTLDGKTGWVRAGDITGGPSATPSATPFGLTNAQVAAQHPVLVPMNNKNVIAMQAMKMSPEVIIAKINASPTSFDTTAYGLQKLKAAGVPDKIIVAMVQAPAQVGAGPTPVAVATPDAPAPNPEFVQVKVPDGTSVELELPAAISSDDVHEGTIIHLKVTKDVVVNGVAVVRKDSEARARVYVITSPSFPNKYGEVQWAMEDVTAVNGDQLPVTFAPLEPPSAASSDIAAQDTGTVWQFRKKQPTVLPAGRRLRATMHGDQSLKIPTALANQTPAATEAPKNSSTNLQVSPEASQAAATNQSQWPKRRFSPM